MSEKHDKQKNKDKKEYKEKIELNDDNDDDNSINKLNINEEYAERFQHNEKRKKEEKLRNKYGLNIKNKDEEDNMELEQGSESPEESEDSEGELDNEIVRDKFINTLLELKDENETKKLLENKAPIFTDDDFTKKREKVHKKDQQEKIEYGIKDALLDNKSSSSGEEEASENNIYSIHYKPKKIVEDQAEKNAFISAANEEISENSEHSDNDNDFFDNGLLLKKKGKPTDLLNLEEENNNDDNNKEKEETPEQAEEKIAGMSLTDVLNKSKINPNNVNMSLLKQIWGDDKKLSKDERFLRNYILSEGWLDKTTTGLNKNLLLIDKEDEENEDKFDSFENKYNHRFEEEGGANITTYQRNIDSYRHKDDTRVIKRKEHDIRKQEEKNKKKEEIKNENIKKAEEIKKKIDKLERIAGTEKIGELLEEFENKDFNMDEFDKKMNEIFDKEYYNEELNKDELDTLNQRQEKHLELNEEENDEENNNEINNNLNNEDQLWFYCDECKKPLKEGKIKYECKTCEDYTLCKKCYKKKGHEHQMKKDIVPAGCTPPENAEELINQVEKEQDDNLLKCSRCNRIIVENRYYICDNDSCKNLKFCKDCRGIGKSIHEHNLIKYKIPSEESNENNDLNENKTKKEKLNDIIDQKANYNIDDIIDGQLGTKFHYTKVPKENSGLTDDMLLLLDDKILNKYLPLKKITAYSDYSMPDYKKKEMLNRLEKLVNKKKRELVEEYENKNMNEKNNEKFLIGNKTERDDNDDNNKNKKKNKYELKKKKKDKNKNKNEENSNNKDKKVFLKKNEFKKKKRLETYGITE